MLAVREDAVHPVDNALGSFAIERPRRNLVAVDVVLQQFRVVVRHFLEMRHQPALVYRITVESSAELIVDAAPSHFVQRGLRGEQQARLAGGLVAFENQIERLRMREFRTFAETAVVRIESLQCRIDQHIDQPCIPLTPRARKKFGLRDGTEERARSLLYLFAARAIGLRGAFENAAKAGPAHGVFRRKICAAVEGTSVRKQKNGERPAALSGHGGDSGLVARIDVGTFVAIDFDRDVQAIDDLREFRVVIAFTIDYVAPVAPHRADVQQDWLVFGAGTSEGLITPLTPVHRLVRGRMQIRAGRIRQAIAGFVGHKVLSSLLKASRRADTIRFESRVLAALVAGYWMGLSGPVSPGSIGLRPAKPSSCR